MDDELDRDQDNQRVNYILNQGRDKACSKYMAARMAFIRLLKKHGLLTERFITLVKVIDSRFGLGTASAEAILKPQ